jgi:hypothetical protein
MNYLNRKVAFGMLRRAGFTGLEIRQLRRFYRRFSISEMDQSTPNLSRLEFVRWLVTTRRLSDQMEGSYLK